MKLPKQASSLAISGPLGTYKEEGQHGRKLGRPPGRSSSAWVRAWLEGSKEEDEEALAQQEQA